MRTRGWRFNGQQYPNALHMAVTRPQTQPRGGRDVRGRPGRRRRLRQGARRRGTHVRRHLRRRGRRHDRRGGRVHPRRHGRHARRAVRPSPPSDPDRRGSGPPARGSSGLRGRPGGARRRRGRPDRRRGARSEPAARLERRARADPPRRATRTAWCGGWRAAARGEVRDQYPGGLDRRAADIEAGAARPAADLVRDVRAELGGGRADDGRTSR